MIQKKKIVPDVEKKKDHETTTPQKVLNKNTNHQHNSKKDTTFN